MRLQPKYLPLQCLYQLFPAHVQDAWGGGQRRRRLGFYDQGHSGGRDERRTSLLVKLSTIKPSPPQGRYLCPGETTGAGGILITLSRAELCMHCFCVLSASPWPCVFTSFLKHLHGVCRCWNLHHSVFHRKAKRRHDAFAYNHVMLGTPSQLSLCMGSLDRRESFQLP